jgi:hypothetical protein
MSVVAIVYFSGYGYTAKQPEAVADGVRSVGATARVYRLTDQGDFRTPLPWRTSVREMQLSTEARHTWVAPLGSSRNLRMPVRRFSDRKPGKTR